MKFGRVKTLFFVVPGIFLIAIPGGFVDAQYVVNEKSEFCQAYAKKVKEQKAKGETPDKPWDCSVSVPCVSSSIQSPYIASAIVAEESGKIEAQCNEAGQCIGKRICGQIPNLPPEAESIKDSGPTDVLKDQGPTETLKAVQPSELQPAQPPPLTEQKPSIDPLQSLSSEQEFNRLLQDFENSPPPSNLKISPTQSALESLQRFSQPFYDTFERATGIRVNPQDTVFGRMQSYLQAPAMSSPPQGWQVSPPSYPGGQPTFNYTPDASFVETGVVSNPAPTAPGGGIAMIGPGLYNMVQSAAEWVGEQTAAIKEAAQQTWDELMTELREPPLDTAAQLPIGSEVIDSTTQQQSASDGILDGLLPSTETVGQQVAEQFNAINNMSPLERQDFIDDVVADLAENKFVPINDLVNARVAAEQQLDTRTNFSRLLDDTVGLNYSSQKQALGAIDVAIAEQMRAQANANLAANAMVLGSDGSMKPVQLPEFTDSSVQQLLDGADGNLQVSPESQRANNLALQLQDVSPKLAEIAESGIGLRDRLQADLDALYRLQAMGVQQLPDGNVNTLLGQTAQQLATVNSNLEPLLSGDTEYGERLYDAVVTRAQVNEGFGFGTLLYKPILGGEEGIQNFLTFFNDPTQWRQNVLDTATAQVLANNSSPEEANRWSLIGGFAQALPVAGSIGKTAGTAIAKTAGFGVVKVTGIGSAGNPLGGTFDGAWAAGRATRDFVGDLGVDTLADDLGIVRTAAPAVSPGVADDALGTLRVRRADFVNNYNSVVARSGENSTDAILARAALDHIDYNIARIQAERAAAAPSLAQRLRNYFTPRSTQATAPTARPASTGGTASGGSGQPLLLTSDVPVSGASSAVRAQSAAQTSAAAADVSRSMVRTISDALNPPAASLDAAAIARRFSNPNLTPPSQVPANLTPTNVASEVAEVSRDALRSASDAQAFLQKVNPESSAAMAYQDAARLEAEAAARLASAEQKLRDLAGTNDNDIARASSALNDVIDAQALRAQALEQFTRGDELAAQQSIAETATAPADDSLIVGGPSPFAASNLSVPRFLRPNVALAPETGVGIGFAPTSPFKLNSVQRTGDAALDLQALGRARGAEITITTPSAALRPSTLEYYGLDTGPRGSFLKEAMDEAADGAAQWLNRPLITEAKINGGGALTTKERAALRIELESGYPQANILYESNKLRNNSITGFGSQLQSVSAFAAVSDTFVAQALRNIYKPELFPSGRAYDEMSLTNKIALINKIDDVARQYLDIVVGKLPNTAAATAAGPMPLARRDISQAQANAMQQLADRYGVPLDNDFIRSHWITDVAESSNTPAAAFRKIVEGSSADQALVRAAAAGHPEELLDAIGRQIGAPHIVSPAPVKAQTGGGLLAGFAQPLRPLVIAFGLLINPVDSISNVFSLPSFTASTPARASEAARRGLSSAEQAPMVGRENDVVASFYGNPGDSTAGSRKTSSGAIYDPDGYSIAHRNLRLGTRVLLDDGVHQPVVARVTNRGPYTKVNGVYARDVDLSYQAAKHFESTVKGVIPIKMTVLDNPSDAVGDYVLGRTDLNDGAIITANSARTLVAEARSAAGVGSQPVKTVAAAPRAKSASQVLGSVLGPFGRDVGKAFDDAAAFLKETGREPAMTLDDVIAKRGLVQHVARIKEGAPTPKKIVERYEALVAQPETRTKNLFHPAAAEGSVQVNSTVALGDDFLRDLTPDARVSLDQLNRGRVVAGSLGGPERQYLASFIDDQGRMYLFVRGSDDLIHQVVDNSTYLIKPTNTALNSEWRGAVYHDDSPGIPQIRQTLYRLAKNVLVPRKYGPRSVHFGSEVSQAKIEDNKIAQVLSLNHTSRHISPSLLRPGYKDVFDNTNLIGIEAACNLGCPSISRGGLIVQSAWGHALEDMLSAGRAPQTAAVSPTSDFLLISHARIAKNRDLIGGEGLFRELAVRASGGVKRLIAKVLQPLGVTEVVVTVPPSSTLTAVEINPGTVVTPAGPPSVALSAPTDSIVVTTPEPTNVAGIVPVVPSRVVSVEDLPTQLVESPTLVTAALEVPQNFPQTSTWPLSKTIGIIGDELMRLGAMPLWNSYNQVRYIGDQIAALGDSVADTVTFYREGWQDFMDAAPTPSTQPTLFARQQPTPPTTPPAEQGFATRPRTVDDAFEEGLTESEMARLNAAIDELGTEPIALQDLESLAQKAYGDFSRNLSQADTIASQADELRFRGGNQDDIARITQENYQYLSKAHAARALERSLTAEIQLLRARDLGRVVGTNNAGVRDLAAQAANSVTDSEASLRLAMQMADRTPVSDVEFATTQQLVQGRNERLAQEIAASKNTVIDDVENITQTVVSRPQESAVTLPGESVNPPLLAGMRPQQVPTPMSISLANGGAGRSAATQITSLQREIDAVSAAAQVQEEYVQAIGAALLQSARAQQAAEIRFLGDVAHERSISVQQVRADIGTNNLSEGAMPPQTAVADVDTKLGIAAEKYDSASQNLARANAAMDAGNDTQARAFASVARDDYAAAVQAEAEALALARATTQLPADDMIARLSQWRAATGGSGGGGGGGGGGSGGDFAGGGTSGGSWGRSILAAPAKLCARYNKTCTILGVSAFISAYNEFADPISPSSTKERSPQSETPDTPVTVPQVPDNRTPPGSGPSAGPTKGPAGPAADTGGGFMRGGKSLLSGLLQGIMAWFGAGGAGEQTTSAPTQPSQPRVPQTIEGAIVANPSLIDQGERTEIAWSSVGTDGGPLACAIVDADFDVIHRAGPNGTTTSPLLYESTRFGLVCNVANATEKLLHETLVRVRGDDTDPPPIFGSAVASSTTGVVTGGGVSGGSSSGAGGATGGTSGGQSGNPAPQDVRTCDPDQSIDSFIYCLCEAEPNPAGCTIPPGGLHNAILVP